MKGCEVFAMLSRVLQCNRVRYDVLHVSDLPSSLIDTTTVYIVNLHLHWVCLYVRSECIEYFDSLGGLLPSYVYDWITNVQMKSAKCFTLKIQDFSSTLCGFFCLCFVAFRMHGVVQIYDFFSTNLKINDLLVKNVVNMYM